MEYIDEFREWLNDNYSSCRIGSHWFPAADVMENCDYDAFCEWYDEWESDYHAPGEDLDAAFDESNPE